MECGVGLGGRTQERKAIAVGQEAATRRAEGDAGAAREADAECLPIEATVEDAKAAGIHIDERSLLVECGKIEREAFDLGGLPTSPVRGVLNARLETVRG